MENENVRTGPYPSNIEHPKEIYMKNYSKTQLRMTPSTGSAPVRQGDTTTFLLPASKVVDLSTLRFVFHAETTGTDDEVVGFPKFMSSLISQFECLVNGVQIMNVMRYNDIYNIIRDYSSDYEKHARKLFNNSDPSVDFVVNPNDARVISTIPTHTATAFPYVNKFSREYVIDDFIGFFDFSESSQDRQSFFNTNLVGDVMIKITWERSSVLWKEEISDANMRYDYVINNLVAYIDAVEFKDDIFVEALSRKLSVVDGVHTMPFKNYKSYTGVNTVDTAECTIRVVENTRSLDKIIFTYVPVDKNRIESLQLGGPLAFTIDDAVPTDLPTLLTYAGEHLQGLVVDRYYHYEYLKALKNPHLMNTSRFFKRGTPGLGFDPIDGRKRSALLQVEIDSQDMHNPMNMTNAYQETLKAFELNYKNIHKANPGISNFQSWMNEFFVFAYSTSHLGGSNNGAYLISGLDTGATAFNIAVKCTNSALAPDVEYAVVPMLITEMTSVLKIGGGRTISLVP